MLSVSIFICILYLSSSCTVAGPIDGSDGKLKKCGELGDCITRRSIDCTEKCGCDSLYYFNETTDQCELNFDYLGQIVLEKFDTPDYYNDKYIESNWEKKIRSSAEKVFGGIIISVILFVTCASLCVLSACIYCCHINYTDHRLRGDVSALANKLNRDGKLQKPIQKPKKTPTAPVAQSCNVVVEDAVGSKDVKMLDMVISTVCALLIMGLLSCLCCLCMKYSDLKMKLYIVEMAKKRGVQVDLDQLDPKKQKPPPLANENCTIIIPEVGIIL